MLTGLGAEGSGDAMLLCFKHPSLTAAGSQYSRAQMELTAWESVHLAQQERSALLSGHSVSRIEHGVCLDVKSVGSWLCQHPSWPSAVGMPLLCC